MDWLTKEEIVHEIATAHTDNRLMVAVDYTIVHWMQVYTASADELMLAHKDLVSDEFCGLCILKTTLRIGCDECILGQYVGPCAQGYIGNPWYEALVGYKHYRMGLISYRNFRRRVKRMLKALNIIRKQLKKDMKKNA